MTTNHCPDTPARAFNSRANEIAIRDFAESILEKINDFTEEFSIDNGIRIEDSIRDNWLECPRCESQIMTIQEQQSQAMAKTILEFLSANL